MTFTFYGDKVKSTIIFFSVPVLDPVQQLNCDVPKIRPLQIVVKVSSHEAEVDRYMPSLQAIGKYNFELV